MLRLYWLVSSRGEGRPARETQVRRCIDIRNTDSPWISFIVVIEVFKLIAVRMNIIIANQALYVVINKEHNSPMINSVENP
jgi:hypothetical protein